MIEVDVTKYSMYELKAMDEWVGENIWNVRPKEPASYLFDSTKEILRVYFTYEEDELAFRLRFPIK